MVEFGEQGSKTFADPVSMGQIVDMVGDKNHCLVVFLNQELFYSFLEHMAAHMCIQSRNGVILQKKATRCNFYALEVENKATHHKDKVCSGVESSG